VDPLKFLPYDMLPLSIRTGEDSYKLRYELMGAWITPNSRAVEQFLSASKARAPGEKFVGYYGPSVPQVRAMFDELKASGVSYVLDPTISSEVGHVQRTRLPSEVLASHNAQCLEGSLLFATLMEAIGLSPFVVHVPGHAFVGWMPTKGDNASPGSVYYLETTRVGGNSTFEEAMAVARDRVAKEEAAGNFKNSRAFVVQVRDMRAAGVTPQPYEKD